MQEDAVWRDLKNELNKTEWMTGVDERRKIITALFEIAPDTEAKFVYNIEDRMFMCRVNIVNKFPYEEEEIARDVFRLTDYFNRTLYFSRLLISTRDVHYFDIVLHFSSPLLVNLIEASSINGQVYWHYSCARDIYQTFQKLIHYGEDPEVLIGDFLKTIKMRQTPQN